MYASMYEPLVIVCGGEGGHLSQVCTSKASGLGFCIQYAFRARGHAGGKDPAMCCPWAICVCVCFCVCICVCVCVCVSLCVCVCVCNLGLVGCDCQGLNRCSSLLKSSSWMITGKTQTGLLSLSLVDLILQIHCIFIHRQDLSNKIIQICGPPKLWGAS